MLKRAYKVIRNRFFTHHPLVLTHMITSCCNAQCSLCNLWKNSAKSVQDLKKEEIQRMLLEAEKLGIICYTVWGGEPLLRNDLPEILKFSKTKVNMINGIITNGALLETKIKEIAGYTDYILLSLDAANERHDQWRQIPGLMHKIDRGIDLANEMGKKIILNAVVTRQNMNEIEGLCKYAKEKQVQLTFEPMEIINGFNEELRLSAEEIKETFLKIKEYKRKGFPVLSSNHYLNNMILGKNFKCHAPKIYIVAEPDGKIRTCNGKYWGSIRENSLKCIVSSKRFKKHIKEAEKCMICDVSCNIEFSALYELRPNVVLGFLKQNFY